MIRSLPVMKHISIHGLAALYVLQCMGWFTTCNSLQNMESTLAWQQRIAYKMSELPRDLLTWVGLLHRPLLLRSQLATSITASASFASQRPRYILVAKISGQSPSKAIISVSGLCILIPPIDSQTLRVLPCFLVSSKCSWCSTLGLQCGHGATTSVTSNKS